ncbi:MAG TPA: sulfotransferase domain-containing protein, partial [Flavobacteriaceae bacterium]|nr:sulfotransferase domain-containing protein [Flavobacteriaceae bacterium]
MNRLIKIFKRGPHYLKAYSKLSGDDIILVSFPKSGNTWVRNILVNYIGKNDLGKEIITFKELDDTMPGLGTAVFFKPWNFSIPKFSSTHFKYFFFFRKTKNVLILRDPRDVMVSYFFYINKKKNEYFFENLYELLIHPEFGLENWFKHTISWYKNVDFIIVYEELLEADTSIIKMMFQKFNV